MYTVNDDPYSVLRQFIERWDNVDDGLECCDCYRHGGGWTNSGCDCRSSRGCCTDVVTTPPSSPQDFSGADGELNFWEMLAFMWSNFTQHLIGLGVVAGVVWILTGYLGLRARRPEEKKLEKILVNKMKET